MSWIKILGEKYGAREIFFRNEALTGEAWALPPKGKDRKPTYIEVEPLSQKERNTPNNLRLYCFRANDHVVFLFNGGLKTTGKAQAEGNPSKPHFELANELAVAIDKAFRDGQIRWNSAYDAIRVDDEMLYW